LEEMKRLLNKDHLALQAVFGKWQSIHGKMCSIASFKQINLKKSRK
jgi:hypothetical protein